MTSINSEKYRKNIFIYKDSGVNSASFTQTLHTFSTLLGASYSLTTLTAEEVRNGGWIQEAALFVMPGGRDLLYLEQLKGSGNQVIKEYVSTGGAYLGLCGGAYYGAGFVEFDAGGPLEVTGERELKFFPGKAIGPLLAPYDYESNKGARVATIAMNLGTSYHNLPFFFDGGCFFEEAQSFPNVSVIGWYQTSESKKLPAILYIQHGKGRVILSGVHIEYSAGSLDIQDQFLAPLIPILKTETTAREHVFHDCLKLLGLKL